jgi:phosphatidylinositol 3-kinase
VDKLVGCIPAYANLDLQPEGIRPSALYIEALLSSDGQVIAIPARSRHAEANPLGCSWDSAALTFPVNLKDLDDTSQIAVTIIEEREGEPKRPLAGTTLKLFSKKGRLKTGTQTLRLWMGRRGDPGLPCCTPGKVPVAERGEIGRIRQVLKRYDRGEVERLAWLDALTINAVAQLDQEEEKALLSTTGDRTPTTITTAPSDGGEHLHLIVHLTEFPLAVVYQQNSGATITGHSTSTSSSTTAAAAISTSTTTSPIKKPFPSRSTTTTTTIPSSTPQGSIVGTGNLKIYDPEIGRPNPSEHKAQKLARSSTGNRTGVVDKNLKPDTEERRRIAAILASPPNVPLSSSDKMLLWRFRYALTSEPRALTKFLKSVDWRDAIDSRAAIELMPQWAPIGVADALELLSPDFTNESVRSYAVAVLSDTDDGDLLSYLLQLVQALRYEPDDASQLARFLVERARSSQSVGTLLFWYLCTEMDDPSFGARASALNGELLSAVASTPIESDITAQLTLLSMLRRLADAVKSARLRSAERIRDEVVRPMLASGGMCHDLVLFRCPCPLDPEVVLRGLLIQGTDVLKSNMRPLVLHFAAEVVSSIGVEKGGEGVGISPQQQQEGDEEGVKAIEGAETAANKSPSATTTTTTSNEPTSTPTSTSTALTPSVRDRMPSIAINTPPPTDGASTASGGDMPDIGALDLNADLLGGPDRLPSQQYRGTTPVIAAVAATEKGGEGEGSSPPPPQQQQASSPPTSPPPSSPLLPTTTVKLLYKKGDDLRQDQLVLQMISLMDRLFRKEHLDLGLMPYRVLPTSSSDGLIEFVPSTPVSTIIKTSGSLVRYFLDTFPDPNGPQGIRADVMDGFIRSVAGNCVVTYVLGVGDRHLDNIMLAPNGHLFHIDFGYILGREPPGKGFAQPVRLDPAMVEVMGGEGSVHYKKFLSLSCEAYNILRKSSTLLLSLLHLMAGSSIPDIRSDPEKALLKLQERLRMDLGDEEAAAWMVRVLTDSVRAMMPQLMETAHRFAKQWL